MCCKKFFLLVALLIGPFSVNSDEFQPLANDVAVVQLSYDGVNSWDCGVGTVVLQIKKILQELNVQYPTFHSKIYLLTPNYDITLPEYSADILKKNFADCQNSGGNLVLLSTQTQLTTQKNDQFFGDPEQWQELCQTGADECAKIINQNPFTVVLAHDTAFAQLPMQLKRLEQTGKIHQPYKALWVPHSTSWSYNGHTDFTPAWPERHHWELMAFQKASEYGYQIGYLCETIKKHIKDEPFNVPESSLCPFRTGIIRDKYLHQHSLDKIATELTKRSIPLDKQLLFSIGRATYLKGQDIVLEIYRCLKPIYPDLHLVLLAPKSGHCPEFIELLKKRNQEEHLNATIIETFDSDLADFIYQWPLTNLILLLSREDTQPLTVMEARANPQNCVVLVSNRGGMGAQVCDGKDGFICNIDGLPQIISEPLTFCPIIKMIVEKTKFILNLPNQERDVIIQNGKELISEKYDMREVVKSNLLRLINDPVVAPSAIEENLDILPFLKRY